MSNREFATNKNWPDLSYEETQPWSSEERHFFPVGKWPWRQQNNFKYRPESEKYIGRNYWGLESEKGDQTGQTEVEWQQQPPFWDIGKMNVWPVEETLKMPYFWSQTDRMLKPYGYGSWDKTKNHSELSKKQNTNDEVVVPKITMKTWNSLTSDPATWPYKLPSAKPWPKDENGKSYNPNADLIRKLGLDKENNVDWSKDRSENSGKLVFEKQTDSISSKDALRNKELSRLNSSLNKPIGNRSNYDNYKKSPQEKSMKETPNWMYQNVDQSKNWIKPQTVSNSPKNEEVNNWNRKFEILARNQDKLINLHDENSSSSSRFWPFNTAKTKEQKWSDKDRNGLMKPWKSKIKDDNLDVTMNNANFWKEKSNNSWLPKIKEDLWTPRMKSAPSWISKIDDNSWTSKTGNDPWKLKPSNSESWTANDNIWTESSDDSWPQNSNDLSSWTMKEKAQDFLTKSNRADDNSPHKTKDSNSWADKFNSITAWKNNDDNWPRKVGQYSWQKINDDWNMGYGKNSAGTWPSKWKQFAYHKVTAVPISKPGTTADISSLKSKNAFVAVSAVSPSTNYNGNDWRRNNVEEAMREDNFRLEETDRSNNQIRQSEGERPIYAWKKDGSELNNGLRGKHNSSEPLENQLEALKQDDSLWLYNENEIETSEV